jgi:hypothetical protein
MPADTLKSPRPWLRSIDRELRARGSGWLYELGSREWPGFDRVLGIAMTLSTAKTKIVAGSRFMNQIIHATFEDGVLKPDFPLER